MREITGTDVRWLARGYWDNHFSWRVHPRTRTAAVVAGAALALFLLLMTMTWGLDPGEASPALAAPLFLCFVVFVSAIVWLTFIMIGEREKFMDTAQQRWEQEHVLPDRASVEAFARRPRATGGD